MASKRAQNRVLFLDLFLSNFRLQNGPQNVPNFGLKIEENRFRFWIQFFTDFGGPKMPLGRHLGPQEAVLGWILDLKYSKNRYETHVAFLLL